MRLPVSLCPEVVAAAAVLAVLPPLDEVEVEKPGLTPPCCCWAAEPDRCRVTRGDRRMPAVGADAGDADEGGASPSGGSLRLLLLLLELELMASIFVRKMDEEVRWIVHYVRTVCSTVCYF